jgi:apolipoprotein N-acyltransferase
MRDSWRTRVARQVAAVVSAMSAMLAASVAPGFNWCVMMFMGLPPLCLVAIQPPLTGDAAIRAASSTRRDHSQAERGG